MIFFYDDRAVGVKNGRLLNRPPKLRRIVLDKQ